MKSSRTLWLGLALVVGAAGVAGAQRRSTYPARWARR